MPTLFYKLNILLLFFNSIDKPPYHTLGRLGKTPLRRKKPDLKENKGVNKKHKPRVQA